MDEYISKAKPPDELAADGMSDNAVAFACGYNKCLEDIKNMPAAGVRPNKPGYWKVYEDKNCWWWGCSECAEYMPKDGRFQSDYHSPYCPNCGARMKGVIECQNT